MIVKVQLSLNAGARQVLVYDREKTFFEQSALADHPQLLTWMKGDNKAFFETLRTSAVGDAERRVRFQNHVIVSRVPDQDW